MGSSGGTRWGVRPQGWGGRGPAASEAGDAGRTALFSFLAQPCAEIVRLHPLTQQRGAGGWLCAG